jgi:hypothetical protein
VARHIPQCVSNLGDFMGNPSSAPIIQCVTTPMACKSAPPNWSRQHECWRGHMYLRNAALLVLTLSACHQQSSSSARAPAAMSEVYAQLDAKCGDDRQTLVRLIDANARRVRSLKGMEMSAELFAVVLNNRLQRGERLQTCGPVIEALPQEIMRD